jgi:NAD+ synthase
MAFGPKPNKDAHKIITEFISGMVRSAGAKGVVLGVSGGIDSALVAKLSVDAIGKKKVLGLVLPSGKGSAQDVKDAKKVIQWLGIGTKTIDIEPMVKSFSKSLRPDARQLGNIKARSRMVVLYHHAAKLHNLVAGTGNKSELLVGYFTKYGDGGSDMLPIGDLYKCQVRELSRELGVPKRIIEKAPSAGLWKGQTDEKELGITYDELDAILYGVEKGLSPKEISKASGSSLKQVLRVEAMIEATQHKRKMAHIPKVGIRTIGMDWRE